jgi:hypothetical protein
MSPTVSATCYASYAFEIGSAIDLELGEQRLGGTSRQTVRSRQRAPQYFDYRPPPIRVGQDPPNTSVAGQPVRRVDVALYDFGAASVSYAFSFAGPLAGLVAVSAALQANAELALDARQRVAALVAVLADAVSRPHLADLVEDYLVFELAPGTSPLDPATLATTEGPIVAQILRSETESLAPEEVADALSHRIAFRTTDVTLVDWNTAVVYDPEPDETRRLIEFANVQLLELRHLDAELDRILDRAYGAILGAERGLLRRLRPPGSALRDLGELQMDAATLYERVSNALKLVGDQYLSRLYSLLSGRFHFADWDRTISRKLEVLDGVYQKLGDRVTARRLEVLEWIVIALIAVELLIGLRRG